MTLHARALEAAMNVFWPELELAGEYQNSVSAACEAYFAIRLDTLLADPAVCEAVAIAICPWYAGKKEPSLAENIWEAMGEAEKRAYFDQARAALRAKAGGGE